MSSVPHVNPAHRIASSGLEFCGEDNADVGFTISSMPTSLRQENTELNWFTQAISVPANLNPKNATSCLRAQSPRVDHNRDRVPDSRPHIASGRSNSIDWKWVASRRHSTASIHLRILQPAISSTTRYGTG